MICQSMRMLSRYFRLCVSEIEYLATLYPVATSSFPFPQSNASILRLGAFGVEGRPANKGNPIELPFKPRISCKKPTQLISFIHIPQTIPIVILQRLQQFGQ